MATASSASTQRRSPRHTPPPTNPGSRASMSPASRGATSQKKKPLTDNKTLRRNSPGAMTQKAVLGKRPTKSPQEQPETSVLKPPGNLVIEKISPNLMSALESSNLRESPSSPMSPLYKSFPPFSHAEESAEELEIQDKPTGKQRASKSDCPCRSTSDGKEWKFKCTRCFQHWHASCCNLKGANNIQHDTPLEASLNVILSEWLCPWCFDTPFRPPDTHATVKANKTLAENVLTCSSIQQIAESVSEVISQKLPSTLPTQLNQLTKDVQDLKQPSPYIREPGFNPSPPPAVLVSPEQPYKIYQENVLGDSEEQEALNFLKNCLAENKFRAEKSHSVLSFGEKYHYTGAGSSVKPEDIPPLFSNIIQRLTAEHKIEGVPNSVLVNYYPKTDADTPSYLPYHSDDELVVTPGTDIITVTLGATRPLSFRSIHNPEESETVLEPVHNSMYTMSRSSQAWYKHGIERTEECDERFSLTMRCVSERNKRSLLITGDSNTKNITFGSGKGKVGETYPGKWKKAARIKDIDPASCIGYSNVVIVCGTNDLRDEYIRDDRDIVKLVDLMRSKLTLINQVSPSTKVFVCPVLPTRREKMNRGIVRYNTLCEEMIINCFGCVRFPGVWQFLDNKGLLSLKLTRSNDDIHLNDKGIALLVRKFKLWVFEREVKERREVRESNRQPQQKVDSPEPT